MLTLSADFLSVATQDSVILRIIRMKMKHVSAQIKQTDNDYDDDF